MGGGKRVAIYTRVSTDDKGQSTENQKAALRTWAKNAGHTIVKVYEDLGISGAKGRDKRPAFDAMLKAAVRREFDILAVWSSDRLGRSLKNLVEVLETIRATGSTFTHRPSTRPRRQAVPCSACSPSLRSSSTR